MRWSEGVNGVMDPPGHTLHLAVTLHHDSKPDLDSPGLGQPSLLIGPTQHDDIYISWKDLHHHNYMAIISVAPYLFMILSVNILNILQ